MKAKVIIENGETTIELTPDNDFDRDVLTKVFSKQQEFSLHTQVTADYSYGAYKNQKLLINIKEVRA